MCVVCVCGCKMMLHDADEYSCRSMSPTCMLDSGSSGVQSRPTFLCSICASAKHKVAACLAKAIKQTSMINCQNRRPSHAVLGERTFKQLTLTPTMLAPTVWICTPSPFFGSCMTHFVTYSSRGATMRMSSTSNELSARATVPTDTGRRG